MRVISIKKLREFWEQHASAQNAVEAWYDFVRKADWNNPAQIKKDFNSASFIENKRVVFNIKGNQYRIVVAINYQIKTISVRFIGTYVEYDRIDATKI